MFHKRFVWLLVIMVFVGLSAALLVGCGGQQATPQTLVEEQEVPQTPTEQQAPQEATVEQEPAQTETNSEATAIDAKTLLEERCTVCHSLEKVQSGQRDLAGWQSIIERMIGKGAKLNEEEAKALAEYLANLE